MFIKNLKLLSLGLILSTTISFCFAVEEGNLSEKSTTKVQKISPIDLLTQASKRYLHVCNKMTEKPLDQATSFGEIAILLDSVIPNLEGEFLITSRELKAISLKQQAIALHNYVCNNYISTREGSSSLKNRVENSASLSSKSHLFLRDAVTAMRESCDLYKELNDIQNHKTSLNHLGVILLAFSDNCAIKADAEEDPGTALSLFIESVDCLKKSKLIAPELTINTDLHVTLALSLNKTLNIYTHANGQFLELCQPTVITMQYYKLLMDNVNLTLKILDYLSIYIMDSSLDFIVYTESGRKKKSTGKNNMGRGGKIKSTSYPSPSGKNVASVLHPRDFIVLPWTTYCGGLQSASVTMNTLSTQCIPQLQQAYVQKAEQHAMDAFNFYKKNVYQGEYANDLEVEKAFIKARLADIVGNPAPLSEFYKALRQRHRDEQHQKLLKIIKAEQEVQRQQEEERRQQEVAKKAQQKVTKILPEAEDSNNLLGVSSPEMISTSINQPSVVIESSPKTRLNGEKIKTHGIPSPQQTSLLNDMPTLKEERKKIILSSDNHHVFHSLTGGKFDRSISLGEVKTLLTSPALGCKISTGGSHPGKATALNGKMWTIPSPWQGPIPHYYRQQLNEFLQNSMEIDPDDVVLK